MLVARWLLLLHCARVHGACVWPRSIRRRISFSMSITISFSIDHRCSGRRGEQRGEGRRQRLVCSGGVRDVGAEDPIKPLSLLLDHSIVAAPREWCSQHLRVRGEDAPRGGDIPLQQFLDGLLIGPVRQHHARSAEARSFSTAA